MDRPLRLLCDEMLVGLGRWLRVAGYDTAIATDGRVDRDIVSQAAEEGRILLTRDRQMPEHKRIEGRVLLLESNDLEGQVVELCSRLGISWSYRPFSRCIDCNTALVEADEPQRQMVPDDILLEGQTILWCPHCHKPFWEGSHVRRMRDHLAQFCAICGA